MSSLDDAFSEYVAKQQGQFMLLLGGDGFYYAPIGDECSKCRDMHWTSPSANHLKSVEHIAEKFGVRVADLNRAAQMWKIQQSLAVATQRLRSALPDDLVDDEPVRVVPSTDIAWKALTLSLDNHGERVLSSYNDEYVWKPFEVAHAQCQGMGACMKETCMCGFYFYWEPTKAILHSATRQVVVRAQIGGIVLEHEDGCRAEYATLTGILFRNDDSKGSFAGIAASIYNLPMIDTTGDDHIWTA